MGETLQIYSVVVEKYLGHKCKIMATYNKNKMLPQRKSALNQWSNYIEKLLSEPLDEVNQLLNLATAKKSPIMGLESHHYFIRY